MTTSRPVLKIRINLGLPISVEISRDLEPPPKKDNTDQEATPQTGHWDPPYASAR